jgi:hypothetical protein
MATTPYGFAVKEKRMPRTGRTAAALLLEAPR